VVGAGIIGLTTAFMLAERGHRVAVLDRDAPGCGASRAANGAITPYSDHGLSATVLELAEESLSRFPAHVARLKEVSNRLVDYDDTGVLQLALGDELDDLVRICEEMTAKGWPVRWLMPAELLELEPAVAREARGAIHYMHEARIDIDQLMRATAESVATLGCTISFPSQVVSVERGSGQQVEVSTTAGTASYDGVLVATGGGASSIEGLPDLKVGRVRGEIIEAVGAPYMLSHCLYRGDSFITPRRDGRLLLGTNYAWYSPDMDMCRETISVGGARRTLNAGAAILPALDSCEVRRVWKGWRPVTPDDLPVLGPASDANVVVADGFGGLGFTLSLAAARVVTDMLCGEGGRRYGDLAPLRVGLGNVE
jgi:glycine oxidase